LAPGHLLREELRTHELRGSVPRSARFTSGGRHALKEIVASVEYLDDNVGIDRPEAQSEERLT
jgi:hypothetical protein